MHSDSVIGKGELGRCDLLPVRISRFLEVERPKQVRDADPHGVDGKILSNANTSSMPEAKVIVFGIGSRLWDLTIGVDEA